MIEGSWSIPLINGSGSGSRRPKNIRSDRSGSGSAILSEIMYFYPEQRLFGTTSATVRFSLFLSIPTLQMLPGSTCSAAVGAARRRGRKTATDNSRPRRSCLPAARPGGTDDWNLAEVLGTIMGQNLLSHAIPLQYHEPLSMLQRWGGGDMDWTWSFG